MAQTQLLSRPTATDDLVRRLQSSTANPKEIEALQALETEMIKIFRDKRRPSHVPEAAALAPVTTASSYQNLSRAFGNAVIHGTADGTIPEPELLEAYVSVLRCAGKDRMADVDLGSVMESLQTRLEKAINHADRRSQCQLIRTLSYVLDALIDVKAEGLDRERLHTPLLKRLGTLSKDRDLRLAQAACYAHQALLGIPNNEGPFEALWRTTIPMVVGLLNVAGAVTAMDPMRLLDGIKAWAEVQALIDSMVKVINALSGIVDSSGDVVKCLKNQKSWYVALRYTDMLLGARAFKQLVQFVKRVPCLREKEFLCGLFAQLERAWLGEGPEAKERIVDLVDVLVPEGCKTGHGRVHGWVRLVAVTLGVSRWGQNVPTRSRLQLPLKRQEYTSSPSCQQPGKHALSANLLHEAWNNCLEARVFYADARVREHYDNDERLKIERLSGEQLPMEQCYINLAIVEQADHNAGRSEPEGSERKLSSFSLLARLKVEAPAQDKQVPLHSLFDARKRPDGTTEPPRRILIRGQAGVGKTTLCKRIVYSYLHERVWAGMFNRLFWVPLRTLKAKLAFNPTYSLEQWLHDEYFRAGDGDKLAKALAQTMDDPGQRNKTLFILDGLDEVSRELDSETPGLLHELLKKPRVIVTSRPSGQSLTHVGHVDLELETIGFDQNQVESYMKMAAGEQAAEIEAFLQNHSLIQGLARIPIQLDALCYSWDTAMNSTKAPTTMTALYQKIESSLRTKDVARLEKSYEGKPLTEGTARRMISSEIASKMASEFSLLRCLAFAGLYSDVIEFDQGHQNNVWDYWHELQSRPEGPRSTEDTSLSSFLAKASFLRSSDASSRNTPRSYHFLHLTFQEFFAAQYFVEHLEPGEKFEFPGLGQNSPKIETTAEVFLRKEKYKARYDVFWRFVAGLLYEKGDEGQLCRFFRTIDDEPRDLLGPTHQRLVMHCLNEVPLNNRADFAHLRASLESKLSKWVMFECSFRNQASLAREMELPEQVLDAIGEESEETKTKILYALRRISARAIELIPEWLKDGTSTKLQLAALRIPQPLKGLPPAALEAIIGRLQDKDEDVRRAAIEALGGQAATPKVLEAIIGRYQHEDETWYVREAAIKALAGQAATPQVLEAIISWLQDKDENWYVRQAAIKALAGQAATPKAFEAIIGRLQDEDENSYIQQAAIKALAGQAATPKVLEAIIGRLQGEDESLDVREAAIKALAGQAATPKVLEAIIGRLQDKDENWYVWKAAIKAFAGQAATPKVCEAIINRLQTNNWEVRKAAVKALAGQAATPKVLEAIIGRLQDKDENWYVQRAAIKALAGQAATPRVFKAIIGRLQNKEKDVREAAVNALAGQAATPKVLKAIISRLQDEDWEVREAAVGALAGQAATPGVPEAIIGRLQDKNKYVQKAAVKALKSQAFLVDILMRNAELCYKVWLEKSFNEHCSLYKNDDEIWLNMPEGIRTVPFDQAEQFRNAIQRAQKALGTPEL